MKYNTNILKQIPIINIAQRMGIEVKGKKSMCFAGHDQKTASLSFDNNNNLYHCFGCGVSGDNIKLVQDYYHINFKTACQWLSEQFDIFFKNELKIKVSGVKVENNNSRKLEPNFKVTVKSSPDKEIYEWLINSCSMSKIGADYLTNKRKYAQKTIEYFNVKDIIKPYDKLSDARQKWGLERLIKCGLARVDKDQIKYVWWNHVILFPFYDLNV